MNTSSCLGLFKEVIVDRTFDGEVCTQCGSVHSIAIQLLQAIPDNVFIVAACNPHRGNSLAIHMDSKEDWVRGSYYVRRLHSTLRFLMWDYGALDESQERDYINSKIKMLNQQMSNLKVYLTCNVTSTHLHYYCPYLSSDHSTCLAIQLEGKCLGSYEMVVAQWS